ncbi:PE-PPE domain-containing protein, partial [Mycobacterium sp. ITM-2017-0098]
PQRKYGGIRSGLGIDTPTPDSDYSVVDIAIEYDGAADFPDDLLNFLAVANALAGFQYVHIFGYADVDLENDEKLT